MSRRLGRLRPERAVWRLLSRARSICEVHELRRGRAELLPRVRQLLVDSGYDIEKLDPGRSPIHLLATPRR